jgi:adenylyl-sulfate kinase
VISLIATGNVIISTSIGIADMIVKIFTYYIFDTVWNNNMRPNAKPCVILLTGLSGSGKTTIAESLSRLLTKMNVQNILLDGDDIRQSLRIVGFDESVRKTHNENVGRLASVLESYGKVVIISMIAPYKDAREYMRRYCKNFYEIYLNTSLEECVRRDVKGLYKSEKNGNIKRLTGVSDPYEVPDNPDLIINTEYVNLQDSVSLILKKILK